MGSIHLSADVRRQMTLLHSNTMKAWGNEGLPPGEYFAATPSVEQTLNEKILEDGNEFLRRINVLPATEIKGEKIMPGLSGPITSRTDTSGSAERKAKKLLTMDADGYELYKTDTDVGIGYGTIDSWAKFPNLVDRYGQLIRQTIANERLMVGWSGTSAAATTDPVANPLLQDVNIGWIKKIKDYKAGAQHTAGGAAGSGSSIELGRPAGAGYPGFPSLDTVVYAALDKLKQPFRSHPDLVALVSRNLMSAAEGKYYAVQGNTPTEKKEIELGIVIKTYGGLPAIVPPFMPDGLVLVTSLSNLSIYWQSGSWRRMQRDYAPKDCYEDFNSRNEGYVVEQYEKCYLLSNVLVYVAP
jgi:P2 family phage major capsid protein